MSKRHHNDDQIKKEINTIKASLDMARKLKPVYAQWYPFLEPLFLNQAQAKQSISR